MCQAHVGSRIFTATLCLLGLAALSAVAAQAQAQVPSDSSQDSSATSAATNSSSGNTDAPFPATQKPQAKVWTNDDISNLRADAPVSTVGAKPSKPAVKPAKAQAKPAANPYQAQINKLQAQLPPIESQIADLQAALAGNTVDTPRKYTGVKPDDWHSELDQLQKNRADILSQIDTLEDKARRAGVATSTLP
jgi:uncharacterized protein YukE